MRRLFATLILLGPLVAFAADSADPAQALFERDWQWRLKHRPEFATSVGDHRYDALLADTSLAEQTATIEHARRMLDLARQIDRAQLAGQDRLSWDLFTGDQERILARAAFVAFDPQPVSAQVRSMTISRSRNESGPLSNRPAARNFSQARALPAMTRNRKSGGAPRMMRSNCS